MVFTFFAGIESINSMVQLDSLKPLKRHKSNIGGGACNHDDDELLNATKKKAGSKNDPNKIAATEENQKK